jgi:hypothetical protein
MVMVKVCKLAKVFQSFSIKVAWNLKFPKISSIKFQKAICKIEVF